MIKTIIAALIILLIILIVKDNFFLKAEEPSNSNPLISAEPTNSINLQRQSCVEVEAVDASVDSIYTNSDTGFDCLVTVKDEFEGSSLVGCGLSINGSWPQNFCPSDKLFKGWFGNKAVFGCSVGQGKVKSTDRVELVGFDFSDNCGPGSGKVKRLEVKEKKAGEESKPGTISPTPASDSNYYWTDLIKTILLVPYLYENGDSGGSPTVFPTAGYYPTPTLEQISLIPTPESSELKMVHYSQCDGPFDDYPLPQGCAICESGCGPSTVAMILSSYINPKFTPPEVVKLYEEKGYYAGCQGTIYTYAKDILKSQGVKVSDYMSFSLSSAQEVVEDFRNYLKAGWTIFTLANYCDDGCGHYFWVVKIDRNNDIWAYDSYYGRKIIPFNENSYQPFPKYRIAFAVKKP